MLSEELLIARDAPAVRGVYETDQPRRLERSQGIVDRALVVFQDGVTIRGLVTGEHEGVHRQGVLLRRRELLFDEAPGHPPLFLAEPHRAILLGEHGRNVYVQGSRSGQAQLSVATRLIVNATRRPCCGLGKIGEVRRGMPSSPTNGG